MSVQSSKPRMFATAAIGLFLAFIPVSKLKAGADRADADTSRSAQDITAIVRRLMETEHLRSVIFRVTVGGREVVTGAMGESRDGVPAATDMHFRNGAVAISYIATLLLELADQHVVSLDDPLSNWVPELPDSDRVTLRMLAMMTAGYPDYVQNAQLNQDLNENPHRRWTPDELIEIGLSTPRVFEPGTNWDYSHTNYVILGRALERITGKPMATLMDDGIFKPLHLHNTRGVPTPAIQKPPLHAFTSERKAALGIPPDEPFYEDSTYWDPSWTLAKGAIQTTNIYDMEATAVAVGTGSLLSPESHAAQIAPTLLGFGHLLDGCPTCHTLTEAFNYGIGVVMMGPWILQNPLFYGFGGIEAYEPSRNIAVAVEVTFDPDSFDGEGNYLHPSAATDIFREIALYMTGEPVPRDAPPANSQ